MKIPANYSVFLCVAFHPKTGLVRGKIWRADHQHAATSTKWAFIAANGFAPAYVTTLQSRFYAD